MELEKSKNYKVKDRLLSPVFICGLALPYYIDYVSKLYRYVGFPRYQAEYSFEMIMSWIKYGTFAEDWIALVLYPLVYVLYALVLFHYSTKIEQTINEPFRKLQVLLFGVVSTVIIIGNVAIFKGNSNWMIMEKLGWCWGVAVLLLGIAMFKNSSAQAKG